MKFHGVLKKRISPGVNASHWACIVLVYSSLVISSNAILMTRMSSTSKLRWLGSYIVETYTASAVLPVNDVIHVGWSPVWNYWVKSLQCLYEFWSKNYRYLTQILLFSGILIISDDSNHCIIIKCVVDLVITLISVYNITKGNLESRKTPRGSWLL